MKVRSTTLLVLGLLVLCGFDGIGSAQKPVVEELQFADYPPPPPTLREMVRAANAVAVVRYAGQARLIEPAGLPPTSERTFELIEVLKFDPALPGLTETFELEFPTFEMEYATRIVRYKVADIDNLKANDRYVVFLGWNPVSERLGAKWGGHGYYNVTGKTVRSLHRGSPRHEGQLTESFLAAIRAAH